MVNDIIQKHNFERYKAEIKRSSANIPEAVTLSQFQIDGSIIPWNNHNITGSEINNSLIRPLQEVLIKQNTNTQSIYKILNDVYHALDFLDSQYIAGIITAVESAKIASNQAMHASDKATIASNQALEASDKAITAQEDIKRTIEALQKTVDILKDFKEQINRRIQVLEQGSDSLFNAVQDIQYVSIILNSITHLEDLDTIWSDVEEHKVYLDLLHQQVDRFIQETRNKENTLRTSVDELRSAQQTKNEQVDKKLKIAYGVAGSAVALSLIQLILLLLGIL